MKWTTMGLLMLCSHLPMTDSMRAEAEPILWARLQLEAVVANDVVRRRSDPPETGARLA